MAYIEWVFNHSLLKNHKIIHKAEYNEFKQASYVKEYKGIYFCFYIREDVFTKLEILLKPHYYYNNGRHNSDDFLVTNSIKTLLEIKNLFNIPIKEAKITNIESGIICISPIEVKKIIDLFCFYERNIFYNISDLPFCVISYKFSPKGKANKYKQLKIYAKYFKPFGYADKNALKIELKSYLSSFINSRLKVKTYEDLLKIETYHTIAEVLKEEISNILIIDYYNKLENLTTKEKIKVQKYSNPIVWKKYLNGGKNTFNTNKKDYMELLDKTGENINTKLRSIVADKINTLLQQCVFFAPYVKVKNVPI